MKRITVALLGCWLSCSVYAQAGVILDGLRDADYGSALAEDPSGDLASPGPGDWSGTAWSDTTRIYASSSSTTLHIYVDLPAYSQAMSSGQIGLVFDKQTVPGGTTEPWGNAITFDHDDLPDDAIRGNIPGFLAGDNGWTELRRWDGSDWDEGAGVNWGGIGSPDPQVGTTVAWADSAGVEFAIPLADLGLALNDTINLEFFTTQGGASKGAYDTVPSDDQSAGWDDPTTHTVYASYVIVPEPCTGVLLMVGVLSITHRGLRRRRR